MIEGWKDANRCHGDRFECRAARWRPALQPLSAVRLALAPAGEQTRAAHWGQEIHCLPSVAKAASYPRRPDEAGRPTVARRISRRALAPDPAAALVLTWLPACIPVSALVLAWPRAYEPALALDLDLAWPRVSCWAAALACQFPCPMTAPGRQSRRVPRCLWRAWDGPPETASPDYSVRRHLGVGGLAASRHWRTNRRNRGRFGAEPKCPGPLPWKAPLLPRAPSPEEGSPA